MVSKVAPECGFGFAALRRGDVESREGQMEAACVAQSGSTKSQMENERRSFATYAFALLMMSAITSTVSSSHSNSEMIAQENNRNDDKTRIDGPWNGIALEPI